MTIKEKYEAVDYTLSELVKHLVISVILVRLYINHSDVLSLSKIKKIKNFRRNGHLHFLLDEMGLDEMAIL